MEVRGRLMGMSTNDVQQFFHGTTVGRADGILREGAAPSPGIWGAAVYVSTSESQACGYSHKDWGSCGESVVLRGTCERPLKAFEDASEIREFLRGLGKDPYQDDVHLSTILLKLGFGGMCNTKSGVVALFGEGSFHPNAMRGEREQWTWLT